MDHLDQYLAASGVIFFRAHEVASREVRGGPRVVTPPVELWERMIPTLHVADLVRARLGVPVTVVSGYRTQEYNRIVAGSPRSQHVQCRALDLTCTELEALRELVHHYAAELDARGVATGVGDYAGFVHLEIGAPGGRRRWSA